MSSNELRGTLPPTAFHLHRRYQSQVLSSSRRSFPQLPTRSRTKNRISQQSPCYDWIFSSATNVHIAIDKASFKTFIPFDSYILTVSGSNPILVHGIGSVDLKIRCKPSSHQSRTITLENVLYVPEWICNIISDAYFDSLEARFEHTWTGMTLQFHRRINGKLKAWCYTEPFCGLDRLVLSRKSTGRSPMLEDKEREVWSVNLNWPQSQRDRWTRLQNRRLKLVEKEHKIEIIAQQETHSRQRLTNATELLSSKNQNKSPNPKLKTGSPISPSKVSIGSRRQTGVLLVTTKELNGVVLSETSTDVPKKRESDGRFGGLKANFNASRGLLRDFLIASERS